MLCKLYNTCFLIFFATVTIAQPPCTLPGQTPETALLICGNTTYAQPPLAKCYNNSFYIQGCTNENTSYGDNNPVYYKFICNSSGTFAFVVTPWMASADYNWQLFDITGKNANDIFKDKTLSVTGNWSGTLGPTGASALGVSFIQCRSFPFSGAKNTFGAMPQLITGHTYLLMIGNMESSGAFTLLIGGGTASITNNINQTIYTSISSCSNNEVLLSFSKNISCSSIAGDGSDFSVFPALASIAKVEGINCTNNAETNAIRISFASPLPNGSYILSIKNGTDNNTLLDVCRSIITVGTQLNFQVLPYASVDTILASCNANELTLKLTKEVLCSSIAADGSDFILTGPGTAVIKAANFTCSNGLTNTVTLVLQQKITTVGNYDVNIKLGTDGNSLISKCNDATPVGVFYTVNIKNAVTANFTYTLKEGCIIDTLLFNHAGGNSVNSWSWGFQNSTSTLQQPTVFYATGNNQTASLIVSNGVCNDTSEQNFSLPKKLKVDFISPATSCANETVLFETKTQYATEWLWNFSNGLTSQLENPPLQLYPALAIDKNYTISLTAKNSKCSFTQTKTIVIKSNCTISVPSAFTPNGDRINDVFGPINAFQVKNIVFKIFNRYGQLVFSYSISNAVWNGTLNNVLQPAGEYIWILSYKNTSTETNVTRKGIVTLIR